MRKTALKYDKCYLVITETKQVMGEEQGGAPMPHPDNFSRYKVSTVSTVSTADCLLCMLYEVCLLCMLWGKPLIGSIELDGRN